MKRDAERFRAEKQADLDKGGQRDRPDEVTLGRFCGDYLKRRRGEWRETTRGNHEDLVNRLTAHFGSDKLLRRIRPKDAHRFWIEARPVRTALEGRDLSRDTRNRILREAKTLFEYAVRWEYIPSNPFASLKQQKVSKKDRKDWHFITPKEYRALLEAAPSLVWRCFYAVAYTAGLRFGELVNLTADDVDLTEGKLLVRSRLASTTRPPFDVKDHEDREVPIPKTTAGLLAELIDSGVPDEPFILMSPERNQTVLRRWQEHRRARKPWTNRCMMNNTLREFRRHARRAGIPELDKLTVHSLRKSCGVNWANHLPIHVTQAYMGHADITTTQQYYLSVGEEHARRAAWVIEQVTMLDTDKNDAKVTPSPENGSIRQVG